MKKKKIMFSEEHLYSIALRKCSKVGNITFRRLVEAVGSAQEVWHSSKNQLIGIDNIGKSTLEQIGDNEILKFAEKEIEFCINQNINILLSHWQELPFLLHQCDDAPAILYQKGKIDTEKQPISIVGTRNSTAYGKSFINHFLEEIKDSNIVTISGLALGTDGEVHIKSLEKQIPTIGILAHGFHTIYPVKHRALSEEILNNGGALFTEYHSFQKPDRENFIQRNRIVAGMSPATIVVETAFGGGSVSTVSFANGYNRDVYALPGKITDKYSQGCNHLIYKNKAAAISTIKNLVEEILPEKIQPKVGQLFPQENIVNELDEVQKMLYLNILDCPNISLDDLAEKVAIPTFKILPILLELEISGLIKSSSGRTFSVV